MRKEKPKLQPPAPRQSLAQLIARQEASLEQTTAFNARIETCEKRSALALGKSMVALTDSDTHQKWIEDACAKMHAHLSPLGTMDVPCGSEGALGNRLQQLIDDVDDLKTYAALSPWQHLWAWVTWKIGARK
jgi:hypothetical protein